MPTALLPDLTSTCHSEIDRLLIDLEAMPSRAGFLDAGALAEVLILCDDIPEMKPLIQPVCDAAARWLRSGLVEDIWFSKVEFAYHAALFACLALRGRGFSRCDMAVLKGLCEGGLLGRNEMPVLTQKLIAACLRRCGIRVDLGSLGERNLAKMIDKRVLRPRSDEYDLLVFIMCAQLLHLEPEAAHQRPSLYPQVLLVEAVRSGDMNWLPVLAFLCARWFGLPEYLRCAVRSTILNHLPGRELLPAPQSASAECQHIERAGRGLRIRSTVALVSSLHILGDSYADERACLAVG
jgi:hypothetical protein